MERKLVRKRKRSEGTIFILFLSSGAYAIVIQKNFGNKAINAIHTIYERSQSTAIQKQKIPV